MSALRTPPPSVLGDGSLAQGRSHVGTGHRVVGLWRGAETPGSWVGTLSPPRPVRWRPPTDIHPAQLAICHWAGLCWLWLPAGCPRAPRPIPAFPEGTGVPSTLVCVGGPQGSAQSKVLIYGTWEL